MPLLTGNLEEIAVQLALLSPVFNACFCNDLYFKDRPTTQYISKKWMTMFYTCAEPGRRLPAEEVGGVLRGMFSIGFAHERGSLHPTSDVTGES